MIKHLLHKKPLIMIDYEVFHQLYQPYFIICLSSLDWELAGLPMRELMFSFLLFFSTFLPFFSLSCLLSYYNVNAIFMPQYSFLLCLLTHFSLINFPVLFYGQKDIIFLYFFYTNVDWMITEGLKTYVTFQCKSRIRSV